MDDVLIRDPSRSRDASGRYADYVRLHSRPRKLILVEQEQELLKTGIVEFGLDLQETNEVLRGTADLCDTVLESQVEKHLQTHLTQPANAREARRAAKGRHQVDSISRRRFEAAVDFYQTLTRSALSRDEARKRVKLMVQRMSLKAKRDWWRLGSRKWFNAIQTAA